MGDATVSNVFGSSSGPTTSQRPRLALTLVLRANDPDAPPSMHLLDDIDVITFGRGKYAATRDRERGLRRLALRIPDPVMSTDHGRMLRVQGRWMLEDPSSKNGATIAARATRCGPVQTGDVIELGHTIFVLGAVDVATDAPLDRILDAGATRRHLASFHRGLVASAEALALLAKSDVPVLLHGETGTGKEIYARTIHELSGRPGPLVAVNCGALSPSLLEAELFGHRRGAFSGATADRAGFVRSADRGTLFLDEIDELSAAGQVALLRVLQEREVVPVGDSLPIPVDLRVCAASHAPLSREIERGAFRSDLYARLLGYELRLPPLRERTCDLGVIIATVLAQLAPDHEVTFTPAAARALVSYGWPLNIRELQRCLATALVLTRGRPIDVQHLPEVVRGAALSGRVAGADGPIEATAATVPGDDGSDDDRLRGQLAAKLVEHNGNISAVARDLGKHREQVQRWIRKFGIEPALFRR